MQLCGNTLTAEQQDCVEKHFAGASFGGRRCDGAAFAAEATAMGIAATIAAVSAVAVAVAGAVAATFNAWPPLLVAASVAVS